MIQLSSLSTTFACFKQVIGKSLITLTPLQKKVLAVSSCILALSAIGYAIAHRFKISVYFEPILPSFKHLIRRDPAPSSSVIHHTSLSLPLPFHAETMSDVTLESQQDIHSTQDEEQQSDLEDSLDESPFSDPQSGDDLTKQPHEPGKRIEDTQSKKTILPPSLSHESAVSSLSLLTPPNEGEALEIDERTVTPSILEDRESITEEPPLSIETTAIDLVALKEINELEGDPQEAFSHHSTRKEPSINDYETNSDQSSNMENLEEAINHASIVDEPSIILSAQEMETPIQETDEIEVTPPPTLKEVADEPISEPIEKPLTLLKDKSDLEAIASQFIDAKLYKLKYGIVSKFLDEIYQMDDVKCEEERTNCILYMADHLIKHRQINETLISSLISSLKTYAKTATKEIQTSFEGVIQQLTQRHQALEILSSYRTLLFKKGDPWQELSNQQAFDLLANIDTHPLAFDLLIKCMLICTFNEGRLDRSIVNSLLSKGLQSIRKETSSIEYGSAGNASHIFEKLYQKYLNVYSDALKVKYNKNGSVAVHELLKKEDNQFIISMTLAHGHYTNTIVDMIGGGFKICDNCAAHLRYDELYEAPPPPLTQYTLYMPQTLYQSVKDRVHLEQLSIPRWEANNCYLSASWLTFAFLIYFYKQAHDLEQEALYKELLA